MQKKLAALVAALKRALQGAERHRAYFYRIAGVIGVVLTTGGVVADGTWAQVMLIVGTVLGIGGNGLAAANTSTRSS